MSALEDPNSAEGGEKAALKASGPKPCALLIVTRAFLPSNSDWWVRRGYSSQETSSGGKTQCWSPISLVRGLTLGTRGRQVFGAPSLDTGLDSPPLFHTTGQSPWPLTAPEASHLQIQFSRLISSVLHCQHDLGQLPTCRPSGTSFHPGVIFRTLILSFSFVLMSIIAHFKIRKYIDSQDTCRQKRELDTFFPFNDIYVCIYK